MTLAIGILIGGLVSGVSSALFPDPPKPVTNGPISAPARREVARWIAFRSTVIVMPVFILALTNPSFYACCGDHEDGGVKSAGWRRRCPLGRCRTGWIQP